MRTKFLISTFFVSSLISLSAHAGDNYIGLGASVSKLNDVDVDVQGGGGGDVPYKTGYGFQGEIGTKLTPSVRGGLEYSFRQNKVDGADSTHDIHAVMANLYYDINTGAALAPYIGAGLGYGALDDGDFYDGIAYQGTAGLSYRFSPDLVGYAGYKYFSVVNAKDENIELDIASHNAELGLRFEFGGDSNSSYAAAPAPVSYSANNEFTPAPPPVVTTTAEPAYNSSSMSAQAPRYVPMDAGATPPVLQATPASQAAISGTSVPAPQATTSYAAPATIPGVKESVYLPQYRANLQPVAPPAQNGWVLTEDPYLADYRAKRGY